MLPNLPTDSLYKFLSLFGVAALISSWILFDRSMDAADQAHKASVQANAKMTTFEATDPLTNIITTKTREKASLNSAQLEALIDEEKILREEIETLKQDSESFPAIYREIDYLEKRAELTINHVKKLADLNALQDLNLEQFRAINEMARNSLDGQFTIIAELKHSTYLFQKSSHLSTASFASLAIGALITLFGFTSWYKKSQSLSDRMLAAQVQEVESRLIQESRDKIIPRED